MKKIVISVIFCLLILNSAFAIKGSNYPADSNPGALTNQLSASIDGTRISMDFDSDVEYSKIANGVTQMCFFVYSADNTSYVELYLMIPDSVESGTIINPKYCAEHNCADCSVTVNEVFETGNEYYTCFSVDGKGYPDGTDFSISISEIDHTLVGTTISGTFSADLRRFSGVEAAGELLRVTDASFQCTIPDTVGYSKPAPVQPTPDTDAPPVPALPQPSKTPFAVPV